MNLITAGESFVYFLIITSQFFPLIYLFISIYAAHLVILDFPSSELIDFLCFMQLWFFSAQIKVIFFSFLEKVLKVLDCK